MVFRHERAPDHGDRTSEHGAIGSSTPDRHAGTNRVWPTASAWLADAATLTG
jgi:hypothetical protein